MYDKLTYREIEIASDATLYDLASAIVGSFDFDMDHAFGFYSGLGRNYSDSDHRYELFVDMALEDRWSGTDTHPKAKSVERTTVSRMLTEPKQKMQFLFDYGDNWRFEIELRGFGEKAKGTAYPRILAVKGSSPEQYPAWEDDGQE